MIVVETFLSCDGTFAGEGCSGSFGVDMRGLTGTQHRRLARGDGWSFKKGKDYCPYCTAKNKLK